MLELIVFSLLLVAVVWVWRQIMRPGLNAASIRRQLAHGIITLRTCTVDENTEHIDGVARSLTSTELDAYRPYLQYGNRFLALFKYGTDTYLRIRETPAIHSGPGSLPPFSYEAFDLRSPGKYFDTSYPFNESTNSREFVLLMLGHNERWHSRT